LQVGNHIMMGFPCDIPHDMNRTPDERRDILRRFMQQRGLKTARWAKESGVNANSIYNFLNGHSEALDALTYAKLARTAEVPSWKISGDQPEAPSPTSIWVAGHVEAGIWREAVEWDQSDWYSVDVPVAQRFRGRAKALEVRGNSMNIEYPSGSIATWIDMLDFRPPQDGDDVVVYMTRYDGMIEATLKRYRVLDGKVWLWPDSTDPLHQTPVNVEAPGDDIAEIVVKGIVTGSYRPKLF
jgi:SOS-response transcriptional repressor LexA